MHSTQSKFAAAIPARQSGDHGTGVDPAVVIPQAATDMILALVAFAILLLSVSCAAVDYRADLRQAGCNQDRNRLAHVIAQARGDVTVGVALYEWQEGERGHGCE